MFKNIYCLFYAVLILGLLFLKDKRSKEWGYSRLFLRHGVTGDATILSQALGDFSNFHVYQ